LVQDIDGQPSAALLWLMDLLRHKVESPAPDAGSNAESARPLRPEEASLSALCTIMEGVGRAEHRMADDSAPRNAESQRRYLPSIASFLHDWPHGVAPFCARWHDYKRATRHNDDHDLRATFGWAFQGLFKGRHKKRRDTLFVIDAVLQYVSAAIPGRAVDFRATDLRQLPQEMRAYCGLAKAAELSGLPRYTITRMIRRKRIAYRVSHRGTRPMYELETAIARKLRISYQPALLYRQGSRHLGVTHGLFRDLRRTGVLMKRHETVMPQAIAICDLDDFKQRMFKQARRVARVEGLESLDQLRLSKCPRAAMIEILKGILRGAIRPSYAGTVPQRINDLFVHPRQVGPIIARFAPKRPPTLQDLQTRYDLGGAEIRTLVRYLSGTPDSISKIPPNTIDVAKLREFMVRSCGLKAYARSQQVGYRAALSRLRHAGTEILQIPAARRQGRFVYFIPRQDG
jgi:hypothetical protein